jgi:hypothetical protein
MAKDVSHANVTASSGNGAKKSAPRRANKPRTFYMVYKGQLDGDPEFAFDRDQLIDKMLADRELKVHKVTVPVGRGRGRRGGAAPQEAVQDPATLANA